MKTISKITSELAESNYRKFNVKMEVDDNFSDQHHLKITHSGVNWVTLTFYSKEEILQSIKIMQDYVKKM